MTAGWLKDSGVCKRALWMVATAMIAELKDKCVLYPDDLGKCPNNCCSIPLSRRQELRDMYCSSVPCRKGQQLTVTTDLDMRGSVQPKVVVLVDRHKVCVMITGE